MVNDSHPLKQRLEPVQLDHLSFFLKIQLVCSSRVELSVGYKPFLAKPFGVEERSGHILQMLHFSSQSAESGVRDPTFCSNVISCHVFPLVFTFPLLHSRESTSKSQALLLIAFLLLLQLCPHDHIYNATPANRAIPGTIAKAGKSSRTVLKLLITAQA